MRIIAGSLRGRQLSLPAGSEARPTADRTREALYDILQEEVPGANVLDLFAGSGCIGVEALSRGAVHCTFCDRDPACIKALESSLVRFGVSASSYRLLQMDSLKALARLEREGASFSVVYIDPPYQAGLYADAMKGGAGVLSTDGVMVVEAPFGMPLEGVTPPGVTLCDTRRYGKAVLRFYRREL